MAILLVPTDQPTIQDAFDNSGDGDTIMVEAGYVGNETATLSFNNITIDIASSVPGIAINLISGATNLTLTGSGDADVTGDSANNVIDGNSGDNTFISSLGADTYTGGSGTDEVDYTGSNAGVTVYFDGVTAGS
ncbi:MAG: hypothetical protein ACR2PF_09185, partial [Rhizobiaceae bacterium]